jgi:hypothetical protein
MKKATAIFFLTILFLPAIYKVGFFTYFQLNRDFIAENYCVNKERPITLCYGQCFLNKGIELVDQSKNSERIISQVKFESQDFFVEDIATLVFTTKTITTFSIFPIPSLSNGVSSSVFRPPLA